MGDQTPQAVGSASDVKWTDPSGMFGGMYNQLQGQTADPNNWMNQFLGQSNALANQVTGETSALQQSLNSLAERQARLGGEAALSAMPGSRNSGAGMAAFGQAYADPFANVQAQIAGKQLDLTGNLWNQAMSGYNSQYNNALALQANLANQTGSLWSPTYISKDGPSATGGLAGAASGASLGSAFGPLGTGIGAGIGGLIGLFG